MGVPEIQGPSLGVGGSKSKVYSLGSISSTPHTFKGYLMYEARSRYYNLGSRRGQLRALEVRGSRFQVECMRSQPMSCRSVTSEQPRTLKLTRTMTVEWQYHNPAARKKVHGRSEFD